MRKEDTASARSISASNLFSGGMKELSEFEYGLAVASSSFNRWVVRCMAATGIDDLGLLDVHVLKEVNHLERKKKIADVCFILNIEDTHTVTYSLRKLEKLGFVKSTRRGKETIYETTANGRDAVAEYRKVREACLIEGLNALGTFDMAEIHRIAGALRAFSGIYDQAARAAATVR